ncbi:MAG: hypothetical protein FJ403_12655 [Verrucomicrobia bacterium]|nr:hypothetical protein [Verrucomicrobiota bacterium]
MSGFTPDQTRAIEALGNVLVEAGPGAGKTRTLVERCVAWLLQGAPHSVDRILVVTFTEAAAAEVRQRIRQELTNKLDENPGDRHLREQVALLDTASISTLHSFCFQLVRQHFYELELDPQLIVLSPEETQLLAEETLSSLLQEHYAGSTAVSESVQQLIDGQNRGWDRPLRRLLLRLHRYAQTLPNPDGWLHDQLQMFQEQEPRQWQAWFAEAWPAWCEFWLPIVKSEPSSNAQRCAEVLEKSLAGKPGPNKPSPMSARSASDPNRGSATATDNSASGANQFDRSHIAAMLCEIWQADRVWPTKKKTLLRKRLERFFEEAAFLRSLVTPSKRPAETRESGIDPLTEDWTWLTAQMRTLISLTIEFDHEFSRAKRELAAVDFHDLEQFALRLLWDRRAGEPTALAEQWRNKLDLIFVDEYQDINAAQDAILAALGRDGPESNRFLVGDVKQSIYRFRLAAPHIFQGYAQDWGRGASDRRVISLLDNFRSHEAILNFINRFFATLMRQEIGGVEYNQGAWLKFGNREGRDAMTIEGEKLRLRELAGRPGALSAPFAPHVEIHLRLTGQSGTDIEPPDEFNAEEELLTDRSLAEQEARLVGLKLRKLRADQHLIWDEEQQALRPVDWRDMVVLLRSPRFKVESFAKEFALLGVPLQATRGGFYESLEVMDLLNLLALLDNPLQDLPLLAVLRSPLAGLSLDELATVRATGPGRFWTVLQRFHREGGERAAPQSAVGDPHLEAVAAAARPKVDLFLKRFGQWRRLARESSLSLCLEQILNDTHYLAWLATQARGEQRQANVSKLLSATRQFDQFHRQGLFRFLRLIEAQQSAEIDQEPAPIETENAVRLMSIHQAKGLEFHIVVVADLGKPFNFLDLKENIILDEKYGLCPLVKPPFTELRYPSLPYWLAQKRQKREILGEEMRLLYVAMTRARNTLILTGAVSQRGAEKRWTQQAGANPVLKLRQTLAARSCLDWLGPWLTEAIGAADWMVQLEGQSELATWAVYRDQDPRLALAQEDAHGTARSPSSCNDVNGDALASLRERLSWQYPFLGAAKEAAKASVSVLRKRINDGIIGESAPYGFAFEYEALKGADRVVDLTAAEVGTAYHVFCQFVSLGHVSALAELESEADRMEQEEILTRAERKSLKLPLVAAFWRNEIGRKILQQEGYVHRELPFTARVAFADLNSLLSSGSNQAPAELKDEFVVVQGVVDLAVVLLNEIWLLDFKTDQIAADQWRDRVKLYAPQLKLYALALGQIYRRPVTNCWLHFLSLKRTVACV